MKQRITLLKLGHVDHLVDFRKITSWKSDFFSIAGIQSIEHLPESDPQDFYLDQKFDKQQLSQLIRCPDDTDLVVGIMAARFVDNFYMHRIGKKCIVVSLYGISEILSSKSISLENFILRQIYEVCAIAHLVKDISSDDVYNFVHADTRGCLFDLNGDRSDILHNTEQPKVCESCKAVFKSRQVEERVVERFQKELNRVRKKSILRIELFIRRYPLFSVTLTFLLAILSNIVSNVIWELVQK